MLKQGVPGSNNRHLIPPKYQSSPPLCSDMMPKYVLSVRCAVTLVLWPLSPWKLSSWMNLWCCDDGVVFFPPCVAFIFCMCHAVGGESLQPHCEMMSQIHKTLTGPFQLLFIIYHPYFIFLWEDLCVCWCFLHPVCCCGFAHVTSLPLHEVVQFILMETTNLWVHVSDLSWESLLRIRPCAAVAVSKWFFFSSFFSITVAAGDYSLWLACLWV